MGTKTKKRDWGNINGDCYKKWWMEGLKMGTKTNNRNECIYLYNIGL